MAAPGCFITTFRRNIENELPQDPEQYPSKAISLGLDHDDFLAAMAPKPVIILAKEKDYFDVRGAEESFARLKRLYRLLGAGGEEIARRIGERLGYEVCDQQILEVMTEDQSGFWEQYGYHNHGDPWREERFGNYVVNTMQNVRSGR